MTHKTTSTLPTASALGLATLAGKMPRGLHFDDPKPGGEPDGGDPKKTGNDDNPGLSARQREELGELLSPLQKQATANTEALAKIDGSIEELTKAVSEGKPKDDPDDKLDEGARAMKAMLDEAIKPLTERLEAIDAKETETKEQSEVTKRVRKYLEAKRPGLVKDEKFAAVLDRIVAARPKDDDAVASHLKRELEYLSIGGVDVEKLGVEPEAEGARETGDGSGKTKEEALERIRKFKTPSVV